MLDAVAHGLISLLTWEALAAVFLGMLVGYAVGILPGLGGPTTLAIMLPFTFGLEPVPAFALLLGMAATTGTASDLTSILFGVPGESTSAATVVDGHPMARKGEAGRALGAALMSSLVGAVVGALVLALSIPIIRPVILSFGSPEFFMLTVVGLAFVAALSGASIAKGLIAAGLGLLAATVGLDSFTGEQRYTFGLLELWDGLRLVPVAIGLFAIPELIDLATSRQAISEVRQAGFSGVLQGFKDTVRLTSLTIRCSIIGTLAGAMPGLGNSVGQWLAYGHAVQSSKNPERFGSGAVEGVIGPGAANNAGLAGALIPTLAFGVPGSVTTAILLGAFLIHGIAPGPEMLTTHLSLTMSFVWIIILTNIAAVGIALLFLPQLVRITEVRTGLLVGPLIALIFVGSFAERNLTIDILIMIAFGLIGVAMVRFSFPRPALVLGLVLGGLAEDYLFLSLQLYELAWLGRPLVVVLIGTALIVVGHSVIRRRRYSQTRRREQEYRADDESDSLEQLSRTHIAPVENVVATLVLLTLVTVGLAATLDWPTASAVFPRSVGLVVLVLLILLAISQARDVLVQDAGAGPRAAIVGDRRFLRPLGWVLGVYAGVLVAGFVVATAAGAFLYSKWAAGEGWRISTAILVGILLFYAAAVTWLGFRLPAGYLGEWLLQASQ